MAKPRQFEANDLAEAVNDLECPVCLEKFIPPIYVCPAGHSICSGCRSKLENCPTCRKVLSDARNFTLEKFLNKAKFPCRYVDQGCKEILKGEEHKAHLDSCYYRPIDCLMCDKKQIDFTAFVQHVSDDHQTLEETKWASGGCVRFNILTSDVNSESRLKWPSFWCRNQNSLVLVELKFEKGFLYFGLREWSPEPQERKCEIKMELGNDFVYTWTLNVKSVRNTLDEILDSGDVGMIPWQTIRNKCDQFEDDSNSNIKTYTFDYSFKIL